MRTSSTAPYRTGVARWGTEPVGGGWRWLTGAARDAISRDTAAAEAIMERAHEAAEQALAELRTVVRGILPPVLEDRGLEGAVYALASDCAVEVDVDVRLDARVSDQCRDDGVLRRGRSVDERVEAQRSVSCTRHGAAHRGVACRQDHRRRSRRCPGRRRNRLGRDRTARGRSRWNDPYRQSGLGPDNGGGAVAVRIVIAEDDTLLREGLTLVLNSQGHGGVVAAVADGDRFLEAVAEHPPRCRRSRRPDAADPIPMRVFVPRWRRGKTRPGLPVLVLSAYVERTFATELLVAGARGVGYLLKERVGRVSEFTEALHRVADGGAAIDRRWCRSCSLDGVNPTGWNF